LVALNVDQPNFWRDVYKALPPAERPYFRVFAGTTAEEQQERIIEAAPPNLRPIYAGIWGTRRPGGEFSSPILQRYAELGARRTRESVDGQVSQYFASHPGPPKDWMGWHPGVDLESVTVKTANQESVDIHQLGLWESQALSADVRFPGLEGIQLQPTGNWDLRDDIMGELNTQGFTELDASPTYGDDIGELRFKFRRRKRNFYKGYLGRFAAQQYRMGDW
jgi:hypothetical protein